MKKAEKESVYMEQCRFSDNTKEYLARYYGILDEMIKEMECAGLNESISHNFIVQMIPHHQAAVKMSKNVLQYTRCIPLRNIATNIITMQTREIADMEEILKKCSLQTNTEKELMLYGRRSGQVMHTMSAQMDRACATNNISADFMREMIPHHRGAIAMAENALHYCICPELKPILHRIIASQSKGIQEMQQLLGCMQP